MPIFEKNGEYVLFVHIPKAGGTSVEHIFLQNKWHIHLFDGGEGSSTLNPALKCSPQHWHWDMLKHLVHVPRFKAIFCTLRDPIERICSEYTWRQTYFGVDKSADSWINQALDGYEDNPFIHDNHIRPQSHFIAPHAQTFAIENGLSQPLAYVNAKLQHPLAFDPDYRVMQSAKDTRTQNKPLLSIETVERVQTFYQDDYHLWSKH